MSTDFHAFREAHSADPYSGLLCDVGSNLECAICQSLMFAPFVLDCGHNYCYPCLKQWFENNNTCPECRTKIHKAPVQSLTLKALAESISEKMIGVDPSLKKTFEKRKKEQTKPYAKDVKKKRVFPAFNLGDFTQHLDEEDGVQRCSRCHWELEEEEDRCTNCGVWVNDGSGGGAAASINVDSEDEESDSRRPGEDISDYEDDGFVVDDEEEEDGDIEGDVTILSDSQASSPARPTSAIEIDDSDLDSEDEQFLPKKRAEIAIDDSDLSDHEVPQPRKKRQVVSDSDDEPARPKTRKIFSDSEDEQPSSFKSKKKSNAIFTDSEEDEQPRKSRLQKKKRQELVVLSDEESEEEDSESEDDSDKSDTDDEGITNGVYTGLPSRRRGDSEDDDEDGSDEMGDFVVDEAEEDGSDDEAEYSEEY